jgi:hypothetical protein
MSNDPMRDVKLRAIGSGLPPSPKWLVKNLLPESGVALLAGQYAAAKTFVGIDLGLSVCLDRQFLGRRVRPGGVLWIAAEGAGEIDLRIAAARGGKFRDDVKGEIPFLVADTMPTVAPGGFFVWLESAIKQAQADCTEKFKTDLRLVVIDTLAAAFGVEDENSNAEAARIMRRLADLGNKYGVLVMPVAHLGKNAETGVRGASAYGAGADVILSILVSGNPLTGEISKRALALTKSRRGSTGPLGAFTLVFHELCVDDEDRSPIGSCFIEHHANDNVATPKAATSKVPREFTDALDEVLLSRSANNYQIPNGPVVKAMDVTVVRGEFHKRYTTGNPGNTSGAKDKAWQRAFKAAKAEGIVGATAIRSDLELMWRIR